MSTSLTPALMIMVSTSATVMSTVPALKEETPDVTVSPSSTARRMTTPSMGEVTFSRCVMPGRGRARSACRSPGRSCTSRGPSRRRPWPTGTWSRSRGRPAARAGPGPGGPGCARRWPSPRSARSRPRWTAFLTWERSRAWLTSGSTRASTWPRFTRSPSRTRSSTTLPERTDFTSTLTWGSTEPDLGDADLHVADLGLGRLDLVLLVRLGRGLGPGHGVAHAGKEGEPRRASTTCAHASRSTSPCLRPLAAVGGLSFGLAITNAAARPRVPRIVKSRGRLA